MSTIRWTPEQEFAIQFNEPERLLISAAAGSGKTAVLTERITVRALKGLVKPSRLLVMTFTELAATQMKAKIMARFRELRAVTDDVMERDRLDMLIRELPLARISTIHAFCNHILASHLTEFADAEGKPHLEPGYRILQGSEELDLRDEAVDTVLTTLYAELDRLEQLDARHRAESDDVSEESNRSKEERDFHAFVPRGVPDLSYDLGPFVLTGHDRTYADWLRDFKTISLAYAPGLDDRSLREAVVSMLEQLRNLPHYENLVVDAYNTFIADIITFPNNDACRYWWDLFDETLQTASNALDELRRTSHYKRLFDQSSAKKAKHLVDLAHATEEMERVVVSLVRSSGRTKERWDEIVRVGQTLPELRLPSFSPRTSTNEDVIAKNDYLDQFFREVLPLAALISSKINRKSDRNMRYIARHRPVFTVFSEQARQSMFAGAGPVARFLELTLLVDNEYKRKRFGRNAILFSDIEHGALAILEKDEIGRNVSRLYDEIYIDEYQDTSSIQGAVLAAIDRKNVFMVGDIKQGIYLFRYANPRLFSARVGASQRCDPDKPVPPLSSHQNGYLGLLNRNFRSRPGIIDFVNDVFSAFLTESSGEIEYDETQWLEAGRPDAELTEKCDPLHIPEVTWEIATFVDDVDTDEDNELDQDLTIEMPDTKTKTEAFIAARMIGELLDAGAKPESIAVLLPTNDSCRQYEEVLSATGIPVASRSGRIFPDNLVSRQVEALLAILDNPRQDIPLLSVLIGPFAPEPLTSEELARIGQEEIDVDDREKKYEPEDDPDRRVNIFFHDRLRHFCKREPSSVIANKQRAFAERTQRWRILATELNAREFLDTVFLETDYPTYIARGIYGASHYRELEQLIGLFESSDRPENFGVRSMLSRLRKALGKPIQDDLESDGLVDGAVHVLTRHSSKGLEWDYVLLGGLDRRGGDRHNDLISFSEQNGLSSYTIGNGGLTIYNNALNETFLLSEEKRFRAESWRLLYVAMTRARERLIMLTPAKNTLIDNGNIKILLEEARRLTSHLSAADRKKRAVVPESLASNTINDMELLLSVLAVREPARTEKMAMASEGIFDFSHLRARVTPFSEIVAAVEDRRTHNRMKDAVAPAESENVDTQENDQTVDAIVSRLSAEVPHREAAEIPAKITVTELRKRLSDEPLDQPLLYGESTESMFWTLNTVTNAENSSKDSRPTGDIARSDMALTMREREETDEIKGASLGTLMHYIIQFVDIEELSGQSAADAERTYRDRLQAMADTNRITREQEKAASPFAPQVVAWAKSEPAQRLLEVEKTTGRVYREMPFTMAIASSELHKNFPDDEITLVQGMIDLWFIEENDEAVLIDFKTDYLGHDTPEDADNEIRRRYTPQLRYYADAIEKATGRKVSEALIWLVRYARTVTVFGRG
ncbi:MAG: UvrD-helicase domain-containing protein [Saccharofermentanales bacterium]|jgi:ATP-dependent helicase/nuclease subunit A